MIICGKKGIRIIVAALLAVTVLTLSLDVQKRVVRAEESYEEKLQAAEDNLADLEKKKKEAAELLESLKEERDSIKAYIEELDREMNDLSLELFELDKKIEETEAELEQTKLDLEEAKKTEEKQYESMKRRIRYMYENSDDSYLEAILSSGSISDILNQVEYMYRITDYDNSLLEKYNDAKQKVIEKENYLEASLLELGTLRDTRQFEQDTVQDLVDNKNKEIEEFTEKIGITDEMLFAYLDEISDQESEIEDLKEKERLRIEEEERKAREREEAARDDQTRPPSTSGYDATAIDDVVLTDETDPYKFIWPLPGDYRTYSKWGPRKAPIAGATTFHKGWDIGGEFGAPIVSVLAGRVIAATYNSSAGNYVKVDHGNGFYTTYCHMSKILVEEGDKVKQGSTLGLVGSTGVSTAPHLHFGVQINGDYVDPAPYMPYD